MTIGIAAYGENAGRAVIAALRAVEAIGSGAIGGFVSAIALSGPDVLRGETQTSGASALKFACLAEDFECAPMAALVSSGPNRPAPLSAFTVGAPGVGVVTGHRLPNATGVDGIPMNRRVLDLMGTGASAGDAVNAVIGSNPEADCGLAAIDASGAGCVMQTPAAARPDSNLVFRTEGDTTVCVLHNAIQPSRSLAALATEIAMKTMQPDLRTAADITLARGCPVRAGPQPTLRIDDSRQVCEIMLPDAPHPGVQVLNLGYRPRVVGVAGPEQVLAYEPFVVASDGHVVSVDGADAMRIATGTRT